MNCFSVTTSCVGGIQHDASKAKLIDTLKGLTAGLQYGRPSYNSRGDKLIPILQRLIQETFVITR